MENLFIREAVEEDLSFVSKIMDESLRPYYDGDNFAHAKRILTSHLKGSDQFGFFSYMQKMFILCNEKTSLGMINLVGKRQDTFKISPLIIANDFQNRKGYGRFLYNFAEEFVINNNARQIYCTVSEANQNALFFFQKMGFIYSGRALNHYKDGLSEIMLYKNLVDFRIDNPNISVLPYEDKYYTQVIELLKDKLNNFQKTDEQWINNLFKGYERRETRDINQKYKLINIAINSNGVVTGMAAATPKKGDPIKIMPLIAKDTASFYALIVDLCSILRNEGKKLYTHIIPNVEETIILQRMGWKLENIMPAAYHIDYVTQQWGFELKKEGGFMQMMRIKQLYLDAIKSGKKDLEVRVGYPNIKSIKIGDNLELTSSRSSVFVKIIDIRKYNSFEELLENEDYKRITPNLDKEKTLSLLKEIYPHEKEAKGVIALELKVI